MKHLRLSLIVIMVLLLAAVTASAQSWKGMSRIELNGGYWSQQSDDRIVSTDEGSVLEAKSSGLNIGFSYNYYLKENMALDFKLNLMLVDVNIDAPGLGVEDETGKAVIVPILAGLKYYFLNADGKSSFRAYGSAAPGVIIGQQNRKETDEEFLMASKSSITVGGQIGLGADYRLGELFMFGVHGAYNLYGNFSEPVGGSDNYSGLEFGAGFSFLFGNRK